MDFSALYSASEQLGLLLKKQSHLLLTAESCTGGLLAGSITDIPGSSAWFERGFVTYTNRSKQDCLGVNPSSLFLAGAVSEQVAGEMVQGLLEIYSQGSVAMSTTGIAGPTGASHNKPVGMVCFGFAIRELDGVKCYTETQYFQGSRQEIRWQAVYWALCRMQHYLLALEG